MDVPESVEVRIRLFGDVTATVDGREVDLGPAKSRVLLAALAATPGNQVPIWKLVQAMWGEDPPRTAERTLQSYLARLRKALGPELILRSGAGYRLAVPDGSVDVSRFEQHLDRGEVDDALLEWTGTPLGGLEAPGLDAMVARLEERHVTAIETALEHAVETDPAGAIGRLTELTALHPYREGLWALLMIALYRVGRQADALTVYRSARQRLVEDLGVEPGPRLRDLELAVLNQDLPPPIPSTPARPGSAPPAGTVTLGIAQIVDSGENGTAEYETRVTRLWESARRAASEHSGHVFGVAGDRLGAAFASTHQAIGWATQVQSGNLDGQPSGARLAICIGLHTGEAEPVDESYFGPTVNIATGLAAAGDGGQLLASGTTADLTSEVAWQELGTFRLAGVVREERVVQLGAESHPPLRLEARRRGNLPRGLDRLVGRRDEVATILHATSRHPVVTLIGPGGIGKTRLALEAGTRLAADHDVWFVDLSEIATSDAVPTLVASTMGVEMQGRTLAASVAATLRERPTLVVLDNCEHVLKGANDIARVLVAASDQITLLATSRERLGVTGERIVVVGPLDVTEEGVALFDTRAREASPDYSASEPSVVAEICRRLDGVPLAIELAASRTSTMSPTELLERLQGFGLLGSSRNREDRHGTLRATIRWSYDLLTEDERDLFERLAVFTGPFDLAAAEAVAGQDGFDVAAGIGDLVDRSLLIVESGAFGRRFRMLETIRQFASERLDARGERSAYTHRHLEWCLHEVGRIGALLAGWDESEGVTRLEELWPNLRSAVGYAVTIGATDTGLALVSPLVNEIMLRSRTELGEWLERIAAGSAEGEDRSTALAWAAHRYTITHDSDGFERMVQRLGEPDHVLMRHGRAFATDDYAALLESAPPAADALRRRGWSHLADRTDIDVGAALLNLGRLTEHDEYVSGLLDRFRQAGPPTFVNWTLMLLGYSASFQGRPDTADEYFDEAIGIQLPPRTHTPTGPLAARAAFRRGRRSEAFALLGDHVDELLAADNMQAGSIDQIEFVNMMVAIGQLEPAARILDHLERSGLFDAPAWRTLVASASEAVEASGTAPERVEMTDRDALTFIRSTLTTLA